MVSQAIDQGIPAAEILEKGLMAGMDVVGEKFKNNQVYVPEVLVAARAMNMGTALLKPLLSEGENRSVGKVCIGTVKGDLHDIGKNLVTLMLKNYGYDVIDLGKDVESQHILDTAREKQAAVIGLSALMTTTMTEMEHVVKMAKEQGITAKIIVGGAVVTEHFAREIGADGYSRDAREAVKLVNRLLEKS